MSSLPPTVPRMDDTEAEMKRTRLSRSKPLKRTEGSRVTRTPMKRSKKRRGPVAGAKAKKEERWALQYRSVEFVLFVKNLPCVRCKKHGNIEVHHDPPRSRGGTWKDTSPLCKWDCHPYRHSKGPITFWAEVGKTYQQSNAETHAKWLGTG